MMSEKGCDSSIGRLSTVHWMIGAIIGIGTGKSFASLGTLSADPPLEIWSAISLFLMAIHP